MERARDLRRLLVVSCGMGRRRWSRRKVGGFGGIGSGGSAVREVGHGHGSGGDGGVEVVLKGLELDGVIERAVAVPHGRLPPFDSDRELLQRFGFLHFGGDRSEHARREAISERRREGWLDMRELQV